MGDLKKNEEKKNASLTTRELNERGRDDIPQPATNQVKIINMRANLIFCPN